MLLLKSGTVTNQRQNSEVWDLLVVALEHAAKQWDAAWIAEPGKGPKEFSIKGHYHRLTVRLPKEEGRLLYEYTTTLHELAFSKTGEGFVFTNYGEVIGDAWKASDFLLEGLQSLDNDGPIPALEARVVPGVDEP